MTGAMHNERDAQHDRWKAARARIVGVPTSAVAFRSPIRAFAAARARHRALCRELPPTISSRPALARAVRRVLWQAGVTWRDCARDGRPSKTVIDARRACIQLVERDTGWAPSRLAYLVQLNRSVVVRALDASRS